MNCITLASSPPLAPANYLTLHRTSHHWFSTLIPCRYIKYVKRLISIYAAGENCVLVTSTEPEESGGDPLATPASVGATGTPTSPQYILILCNSIGSPVDSKYIDVRPDYVAMTPYHVIVSSTDTLYIWQYRTAVSKLTSIDTGSALRRKEGRERVFHIDDTNAGALSPAPDTSAAGTSASARAARSALSGVKDAGVGASAAPATDAICCIAASQQFLLVGRESGTVQQYSLPQVTPENKFTLRCRPNSMNLNCDSTRFAIIDINNVLSFFDLEARTVNSSGQTVQGEHLAFEKKDIWVSASVVQYSSSAFPRSLCCMHVHMWAFVLCHLGIYKQGMHRGQLQRVLG